jgi:SLOG family YspA-like protein
MKVLVCGGRNYADYDKLSHVLSELHAKTPITELIHGGYRGADQRAGRWAKAHGIPVHVYHADWDAFGPRAGPIRNQRMLDDGKPELVVAFPGHDGTADMVRRAKTANVTVMEVP